MLCTVYVKTETRTIPTSQIDTVNNSQASSRNYHGNEKTRDRFSVNDKTQEAKQPAEYVVASTYI